MDTPSKAFPAGKVHLLWLALLFGLPLFLIILFTIHDYGFTWDEAETNFPAARRQAIWLQKLLSGERCVNEATVREYFETESDHPSLPRTVMAFGRLLAPAQTADRIAFAWPTGLICALFHVIFVFFLSRRIGVFSSLVGSLVLFFHPRWFGHTHFAEYDILIAVAWFYAAASFWKVFEILNDDNEESLQKGFGWLLLSTGLFGLALATKLHAFFLPFPLLAWAMMCRKKGILRWCCFAILIPPGVYFLTQPYLWWNTWERLVQRFTDYGAKVPITVFYLGEWFPGTTPWHYPWVLLWSTLPTGFLILSLVGIIGGLRSICAGGADGRRKAEWFLFILLNAATVPILFSFKSAYDGIRFFLPSLPFIAILAAEGYLSLNGYIHSLSAHPFSRLFIPVSAGLLVVSQIVTCYLIHPYQLEYYSLTAGGIRGAHHIGLETTYWCDAMTPDFISNLARQIPPDARIATHAMDDPPIREYQLAGDAPMGWKFAKEGPVDCRILQFRQGFFGQQEQRLVLERKPLVLRSVEGVPLIAAFPGP